MSLSDPQTLQRIGFVLMPNFALMSYASATEPLRAANLIAGLPLYEPMPLSADGQPVLSSSGLSVECADVVAQGSACHTIFVCAGGGHADWGDYNGLHASLRKLARQGVRIGGISSGAYILAAAGLLENRDFTIHWEHADVFREAFPHLTPRQARYVIDGDRVTCGGGVAPLDMMHAMISQRMGSHFARRVSDWYLHTAIAEPTAPQRGSTAQRFGTHHPALLIILEKMEATIEKPMDRLTLAALGGVSARHLDRLFTEQLGKTFLETYRLIRLRHAQNLLEQSALSISEIAFATGFSSASHLSRVCKAALGKSPGAFRLKFLGD
ncbi:GlxA family transcriptional regulator [Agrobacterium rosae]|uniref:Carnitine catabolism transcriptional activator n=1 Tax=Agrobacterium rosae TaxID=1972867 RepID=A0A1R3TMU0_9HYPH|nr:GlxA family transcriptional regulator [Agrobacterium rosae]SCX11102.1 Carnitine catabolism transcriptional activator [Agrobacterium rosae]